MTPPRALESLCVCFALCLIPRMAFGHGESLLIWMFYEVAAMPWAVVVWLVARRRVLQQTARNRVGPLIVVTTLVAILGGWFAIPALADVISDPSPLSPLLLAISGAPGVWYLWRGGANRWAVGLLLIPIVLTGSCNLMAWSSP